MIAQPIILPGLPGHPFDRIYQRPGLPVMLKESVSALATAVKITIDQARASGALALQSINREEWRAILAHRARQVFTVAQSFRLDEEIAAFQRAVNREDRARAHGAVLFCVPVYQPHASQSKTYRTAGPGSRECLRNMRQDAVRAAKARGDLKGAAQIRMMPLEAVKDALDKARRIAARVNKANASAGAGKAFAR